MSTDRIARLTDAMQKHNFDAIAIVPGANLRYLTGLDFHTSERLTLALWPADGTPPCFVLPAFEATRAQATASIPLRLYPWSDAEGPGEALRGAVKAIFDNRPAQVGVEYTAMRVMELRGLEQSAPGLRATDATPLLSSMRMAKDQSELAAMAEAARIIDVALQNLLPHIKAGITERQLATIWSNEIIAAGADGESFTSIIASGPNSARPHHNTSDRAFEAGDLIILDGGAVYGGYMSDITRTVALGEPGPEARKMYDLVLAANTAGRAAVRPGVTGAQIDQAARQVISDGGYGDYFLHRTGHGLGLEAHEPPYIVAGSTQPLAVGTTFTVEPGIYIEGVGGVRIEDDVVITEEGGKSLTSFERALIVLPV